MMLCKIAFISAKFHPILQDGVFFVPPPLKVQTRPIFSDDAPFLTDDASCGKDIVY